MKDISVALANLSTRERQSVVRLLTLMAKEADQWSESVSDNFRPKQTEPKHTVAMAGSNTVYTIGDLRRARVLVSTLETLA